MISAVAYCANKATESAIRRHLLECDSDFVPPLSERVDIASYAKKIATNAMRFEAWCDDVLIGLVAAYCNDKDSGMAYVTNVSVLREWMGRGIAVQLMARCVEHVRASGMLAISLEVAVANKPAIRLYEKNGFVAGKTTPPFVTMSLILRNRGKQ